MLMSESTFEDFRKNSTPLVKFCQEKNSRSKNEHETAKEQGEIQIVPQAKMAEGSSVMNHVTGVVVLSFCSVGRFVQLIFLNGSAEWALLLAQRQQGRT